eukprot:jgi/Botrbrau1/1014/Bobra.114_1s0052.1
MRRGARPGGRQGVPTAETPDIPAPDIVQAAGYGWDPVYIVRQYGGMVISVLALAITLWNYDSSDDKNQGRIYMCFAVVIIALILHETRPYQRQVRPPVPQREHQE